MTAKTVKHDEVKERLLKDPEICKAYEDLEPAYQVARLRMMRHITQQQLAEMVGTQQSSIARLESGKSQPRLDFLQKVVAALGGHLKIQVEP